MKYIKPGKRQLILTALLLTLGTAVYLNWKFAAPKELADPTENATTSTKELGQAQFVNNTVDGQKENKTENNKQNDETSKNSEYFTKIKSERQKAKNEATKIIKEIIENDKSSEETKAEAVKQASIIAQKIEEESNIESLVMAKGFKECTAFIQNDECSIVVGGQPLTEILATQIKDIVCSQGKIAVDKIKIIESK